MKHLFLLQSDLADEQNSINFESLTWMYETTFWSCLLAYSVSIVRNLEFSRSINFLLLSNQKVSSCFHKSSLFYDPEPLESSLYSRILFLYNTF
jgi:hypothetical protein